MTTEAVYSSEHPTVLAWADEGQAAWSHYHDMCKVLKATLPDDAVLYQRLGRDGGGITAVGGSKPGEAWRYAKDGWVPYRNHLRDPVVITRFYACRYRLDRCPGQPSSVWSGEPCLFSEPGWRRIGDTVWVTWSRPHATVETDGLDGTVDLAMWQRRKLSEYWAAVEAITTPNGDAA